ncbi:MAG: sigma-70 family RNA polymerase sigma factor [Gemmatimonadaceae bacterium]
MGLPRVTDRPPDPDTELLDGCRRGDPHAQRALFDRHRDRIYSIALHYLRGDGDAAQDVTQEVFVKLFRAADTFRADARLSTWLYRVVANACADELRRRRRLVLLGDVPAANHPQVEQPEPTAPDGRVSAALQGLSPRLRLVVVLRYFDDLSYDEIGEAIGVTSGTVASRLNRAHAILKRKLDPLRASFGGADHA